MTLLVLYLLASLDGAFCGFRTSMGRHPYIQQGRYYTMAVLRGTLAAQIASWASLFVLLAAMAYSENRTALRSDLEAAAARMLLVFLPYAALVVLNLALRLVPSTDLRSATSVLFLGPLTALRPFLMIAGVLFGIWRAQLRATILLGLFVLALMLSLEFALNLYNGKVQEKQIRLLI
jgi:hypothetical protein